MCAAAGTSGSGASLATHARNRRLRAAASATNSGLLSVDFRNPLARFYYICAAIRPPVLRESCRGALKKAWNTTLDAQSQQQPAEMIQQSIAPVMIAQRRITEANLRRGSWANGIAETALTPAICGPDWCARGIKRVFVRENNHRPAAGGCKRVNCSRRRAPDRRAARPRSAGFDLSSGSPWGQISGFERPRLLLHSSSSRQ